MSIEDEIKAAALKAAAEAKGKEARRVQVGPTLVEGQDAGLPPAQRPQSRRQAEKTAKRAVVAPKRGKIVSCSDGKTRNLSECWEWLFQRNLWDRLTDEELQASIKSLFPEAGPRALSVRKMRVWYNDGKLEPQKGMKPNFKSVRYLRYGGRTYSATPRGMAIAEVKTRAGRYGSQGRRH